MPRWVCLRVNDDQCNKDSPEDCGAVDSGGSIEHAKDSIVDSGGDGHDGDPSSEVVVQVSLYADWI